MTDFAKDPLRAAYLELANIDAELQAQRKGLRELLEANDATTARVQRLRGRILPFLDEAPPK